MRDWLILSCVLVVLGGWCGELVGKEDCGGEFVRFVTHADGRAELQTTVTSYQRAEDGVRVDLIGAVHVGDGAYYAELQRLFRGYDALLFEMVGGAPAGPVEAREGGSGDPGSDLVAGLQMALKGVLGLEHQLERIDYGADNFVHADMTEEQFLQAQLEMGESLLTILLKMWLDGVRRAMGGEVDTMELEVPEMSVLDTLAVLAGPHRSTYLKHVMGPGLGDSGEMSLALEGDADDLLIVKRNVVAMEVLEREIAGGTKRLGLFYGAAHLPDFEERLVGQGFEKVEEMWVTAWDVPGLPPVSEMVGRGQ
jgi:hypothetical protein